MTERKLIRQSALDRLRNRGIMNIGKGAADRRLAPWYCDEVNRTSLGWGCLLLFYDRNDQTGKGDENHEQLERFLICNHIHIYHPLPVRTGGEEASPPERGG